MTALSLNKCQTPRIGWRSIGVLIGVVSLCRLRSEAIVAVIVCRAVELLLARQGGKWSPCTLSRTENRD